MSGCEEIREMLIAVARGEAVSTAAERFVREHVAACAPCQRRLQNEKALSAGLAAVASATTALPSPAVKAALLTELRSQRKVTPIRRPLVKWTAIAAAAAALVLAAWMLRQRPAEAPVVAVAPAPVPAPITVKAPAPPAPAVASNAPVKAGASNAPVKVAAHRVRQPKPPATKPPATKADEPTEVASDFFEIPYSEPLRPNERADVFRIEMPRASMAVYGLPVMGGRLDSRIKADVLMGEDGVARAIRFIR